MPSPEKVRRRFGFPKEGDIVDGFKVKEATIGHIQIERYRKYRYPIRYLFEGEGNEENVEEMFRKGRRTVVVTSYGNPYLCTINNESIKKHGDILEVDAVGTCTRIRKSG